MLRHSFWKKTKFSSENIMKFELRGLYSRWSLFVAFYSLSNIQYRPVLYLLEIISFSKIWSPLSKRTFKQELGYEKLYRELFYNSCITFCCSLPYSQEAKKTTRWARNKSTERIYLPTNIHIRESWQTLRSDNKNFTCLLTTKTIQNKSFIML